MGCKTLPGPVQASLFKSHLPTWSFLVSEIRRTL